MAPSLDGVRLKLDNAQTHLERLESEIWRYRVGKVPGRGEPYRVVHQSQSESDPYYVIRVVLLEEPPPMLGVLIGDWLPNVRSALDHIAWQLAGSNPPPRTEFPIFLDPRKYHAVTKKGVPTSGSGLDKVRGLGPGPQAAIESLQPYHRGHAPSWHPLWILHELSNFDKHRTLHVAAATLESSSFSMSIEGQQIAGATNIKIGTLTVDPSVRGTEVARFGPIFADPAKVHGHAKYAFDVAFAQDGPAAGAGRIVLPTLTDIRDFVGNEVLPAVLPFF